MKFLFFTPFFFGGEKIPRIHHFQYLHTSIFPLSLISACILTKTTSLFQRPHNGSGFIGLNDQISGQHLADFSSIGIYPDQWILPGFAWWAAMVMACSDFFPGSVILCFKEAMHISKNEAPKSPRSCFNSGRNPSRHTSTLCEFCKLQEQSMYIPSVYPSQVIKTVPDSTNSSLEAAHPLDDSTNSSLSCSHIAWRHGKK